jgi:hypothetical protein
VTGVGFVREDGTFAAAALNYAMHPVALSHENRRISADWPGAASAALTRDLPGSPVVLVSNGAAGNLNPPIMTTDADEVNRLGEQVAAAVGGTLLHAPASDAGLMLAFESVALPLQTHSAAEVDAIADAARGSGNPDPTWQRALDAAIATWREMAKAAPADASVPIDLQTARIGEIVMLAVNGEMFSRFTAMVRERTPKVGMRSNGRTSSTTRCDRGLGGWRCLRSGQRHSFKHFRIRHAEVLRSICLPEPDPSEYLRMT